MVQGHGYNSTANRRSLNSFKHPVHFQRSYTEIKGELPKLPASLLKTFRMEMGTVEGEKLTRLRGSALLRGNYTLPLLYTGDKLLARTLKDIHPGVHMWDSNHHQHLNCRKDPARFFPIRFFFSSFKPLFTIIPSALERQLFLL